MPMRSDLLLVHVPSVFDFRERLTLYGPISDVIPSTPVFEMYPIGFATMSHYLDRLGFKVRILNLAVKMLRDRDFDPESYLKKFKPALFGLDLHWLTHIHGVVEAARLLKRLHPEIPIVLGGLTASYFHREILESYPEIDYVIRGDCAEEPVAKLLSTIRWGGDPGNVPNLSYRRGEGIVEGAIELVPDSLDDFPLNYRHMIRQVHHHRDLTSYSPFRKWLFYPITAVLTCKGCIHDCVTCGGSLSAMKRVVNRHRIAFKDPKILAGEVSSIINYLRGPIFFVGDCLQGGPEHFQEMMKALRPLRIKNEIMMEFFSPPGKEVLKEIASTFEHFNLEISPESHDEEVRKAFGRPFDNRSLEGFIEDARSVGCRRMDLFFMTGLPRQDCRSVLGTVDYCRSLMREFGSGIRLVPFVSPLAPFVDPGSDVFEEPGKYGYRLRFRTLEEHRQAMLALTWVDMLNYETRWMDRETIAVATYESAIGLSLLKSEHGQLSRRESEAVVARARAEMEFMTSCRTEGAASPDGEERTTASMKRYMRRNRGASVCRKEELNMPVNPFRLHLFNLARLLLTGREDSFDQRPASLDPGRQTG
ncbi:MAG: TIGR04190 family B12-binding domain/radical SAM domain protein [bacterium]|nr:MAG: TIGR04190 family B12-binding domain/radical SAM domain protein [bacterium]